MIHFSAFTNHLPQEPIPDELSRQWASGNLFPKLANTWTYSRDNVFFSIQGDCPLSPFVYASPQLVLICDADLLGFGAFEDFGKANKNPAQYMADLYKNHGDEFARQLRGWFGIVIYDHEQQTLKAWTDHFGVRRVVYRATSKSLGIASDLRLLNNFFPQQQEIDPEALFEYLQFSCVPAPRTIYRDVYRLEPGHWLSSSQNAKSNVYWDMKYHEVSGCSEGEWATQTFDAIQSAVFSAAKTLDPSQRVGCFLSGGTDSSSVSALVGQFTGEPVSTFSIGFDDPRYNEIEYARIAARHFKSDHHEYFVKPQDILDILPAAVDAYDEPFGNSSIIPAYYCARMGAEIGLTHMLAGDGGDELFGGNQRYASDQIFRRYWLMPGLVRTQLLEPAVIFADRICGLKIIDRARSYIKRANILPPERYFSYDFLSNVKTEELLTPLFQKLLAGTDPLAPAKHHFHTATARNDLNRWLYLDVKITITDNDIRKVTKMAELAGIVPRYPLLDHLLAEFSGKIPYQLKVRGTQLRYLFKKAMSKVLPSEILNKKKHGFGLPFSVWMGEQRELRNFVFDTLGTAAARQRGYLRPDLLEWLWGNYEREDKIYYGDVLWVFLMLELWHTARKTHKPAYAES
jgi:asparagine synthase (glutamine-hydrolysing)